MFRLLLDSFDAKDRAEFVGLRHIKETPAPAPPPTEPIGIPPGLGETGQPVLPAPKAPRKPRAKKTVNIDIPVAPPPRAPSPIRTVTPPRAPSPDRPPAPRPQSKRQIANRDLIIDRLSRMKAEKRDELMGTVEELAKEPEKIQEEIKKARGRLKVLKSAEELLKPEPENTAQ